MGSFVWAIGVSVGIVVLYLLWAVGVGLFGAKSRRLALLVSARRLAIASATEGQLVKIEGWVSARTPEPATSRVTAEPLVCSHLSLTYRSGDSRFFEIERHVPFVVEDESGEALVEIERMTVGFVDRKRSGRLEGEALRGWAQRAIEADGVTFAGEPGGALDIEERWIAPGDRIAVLGIARWQVTTEGVGAGMREPPRRLVITADPKLGVIASAHRHAFNDS